jgi:hypothetical protein
LRREALRETDLSDSDCFHNGKDALPCVTDNLSPQHLLENGRRSDTLTGAVLSIIADALVPADYRAEAKQMWHKSQRALRSCKYMLEGPALATTSQFPVHPSSPLHQNSAFRTEAPFGPGNFPRVLTLPSDHEFSGITANQMPFQSLYDLENRGIIKSTPISQVFDGPSLQLMGSPAMDFPVADPIYGDKKNISETEDQLAWQGATPSQSPVRPSSPLHQNSAFRTEAPFGQGSFPRKVLTLLSDHGSSQISASQEFPNPVQYHTQTDSNSKASVMVGPSSSYGGSTFVEPIPKDQKGQRGQYEQHKSTLCDEIEDSIKGRDPSYDDEIQSVISDNFDIRSQLSNKRSPQEVAGENLIINFFAENEQFKPLYAEAVNKIGEARFINNFRRLLKSYYLDLSRCADTNLKQVTTSLLKSRWSRIRVAQGIINSLLLDNENTSVQMERKTRQTDSKAMLEKWIAENSDFALQAELSYDKPDGHENSLNEGRVMETSDLDDDDDDLSSQENHVEDGAADVRSHIVGMESFLKEGNPFQSLLISFIMLFLPISLKGVIVYIPQNSFWFSSEEDTSISNRLKGLIENRVGVKCNYWPLQSKMRPLQPSETRLHWYCVSTLYCSASIKG